MSGTGTTLRPIAALFVTKGGTYYDLPAVDPWDEERDARLYDGPYPVVAHPPCQRWCRFAKGITYLTHPAGRDRRVPAVSGVL